MIILRPQRRQAEQLPAEGRSTMELKDKTALVTGGGSGIGLAVARALAREGCRVVIAGRTAKTLEEALGASPAGSSEAGPPILAHPCDVADRADVGRLWAWIEARLDTPEILVNSAGVNVARRRMADLDPADWDQMLAVNVTGAFNCIHAALPGMRRRRSGLIVNISSVAGKRVSLLGGVGYCASKFAMTALGTEIGLEERENGIHVTNIYPGEVDTPILKHRPVPVPPEKRAQMLQGDDIAQCVVTIARLHPRAVVRELVITPLYQEYA
jgi:NAD(P)-dependent dehydrogenase (short-subunit alcohol dehydrogenase family)